jgi:uncharacterized protein
VTDVARADELRAILAAEPWFMDVLEVVAEVDPPDWFVGAGAVRDLVWDVRFGGGFEPARVKDVDVAFFDPHDLTSGRDAEVELALSTRRPEVTWDAKNQAAVHRWYPERYGLEVAPLRSTAEGIGTWPEPCTCVGARLEADGALMVVAPLGLDELLDGTWSRNPVRVTPEEAERRRLRKDPVRRWTGVTVR